MPRWYTHQTAASNRLYHFSWGPSEEKERQHYFTMRLLEPGHLEEDCLITTISEKKILKFFFFFLQTNQWNSRFNYETVETFKTVWTYLTSQETALKFMNVFGPLAKKTRNRGNWTFSFLVPRFEQLHCNQANKKVSAGIYDFGSLSYLVVSSNFAPWFQSSVFSQVSYSWRRPEP